MNRILHIDGESRSVHVQAGAVLEAVDLALNPAGFILGHDPWTVPVATIGGAISTNSVGYRAGIYAAWAARPTMPTTSTMSVKSSGWTAKSELIASRTR